jgi:alkanesulfonate monooxygenase SsuD/methylene tetrahydromethanopterin reductase-like flavin-dependent oxidoreductase (luciferase family)
MAASGRDPHDCKIMFCTSVTLGDTSDEARQRRERFAASLAGNLNTRLAGMSYLTGIDFSKFPLDEKLPEITTNASRASFAAYLSDDRSMTLREMLLDPGSGGIDFIGTSDSVAAEMGETMQEIGGDGFLVHDPLTRRAISEITDGLVPALRRRGLMRAAYSRKRFRDNLLEF